LDEFVRPVSVEADFDDRMSQIGLNFSSSRLEETETLVRMSGVLVSCQYRAR
jgi:hypothetical protein